LLYDGTTNILVKTTDGTVLRDSTLMMTRDGTITFNNDEGLVIVPLAIGGWGLWLALAIAAVITIFAIWQQSKKKKKRSRRSSRRGR